MALEGDVDGIPGGVERGALPDWSHSEALREAASRGRLDAIEMSMTFAPSAQDASLTLFEAAQRGWSEAMEIAGVCARPADDRAALSAVFRSRHLGCLAAGAKATRLPMASKVDGGPFEKRAPSRARLFDATREAIKHGEESMATDLSKSLGEADMRSMQAYAKKVDRKVFSGGLGGAIQAAGKPAYGEVAPLSNPKGGRL